MKRLLSILFSFCILIGLSTGCSNDQKSSNASNPQTDSKQKLKVFTFGDTTFNPENSEPDINPHRDSSGWAAIRYGVGETLFRYSESMGIEPWLAKSYELVNEKTWKITLRENIAFTSGRLTGC